MKVYIQCALVGAVATALSAAVQAVPAPVVRYSFDETGGPPAPNAINSVTPGTFNGIFRGGTSRVSDTPNVAGGLSFNAPGAVGDYLEVIQNGAADDPIDGVASNGAFTIATWMKLPSDPNRNDMVASSLNFRGGMGLFIDQFNNTTSASNFVLKMRAKNAGILGADVFGPVSNVLNASDWIFVAMTYDGSGGGGGVAKFFSGSASTPASQSGADSAFTAAPDFSDAAAGVDADDRMPLILGAQALGNNSDGNEPPVRLDDFQIHYSALTQAELQELQAQTVPVPEPASLALLTMAGLCGFRRRR